MRDIDKWTQDWFDILQLCRRTPITPFNDDNSVSTAVYYCGCSRCSSTPLYQTTYCDHGAIAWATHSIDTESTAANFAEKYGDPFSESSLDKFRDRRHSDWVDEWEILLSQRWMGECDLQKNRCTKYEADDSFIVLFGTDRRKHAHLLAAAHGVPPSPFSARVGIAVLSICEHTGKMLESNKKLCDKAMQKLFDDFISETAWAIIEELKLSGLDTAHQIKKCLRKALGTPTKAMARVDDSKLHVPALIADYLASIKKTMHRSL